uniref:5-formyltetrahydrofolate cyclo-ligase n=1 Tax=Thermofilum pendens TaxID=2269 RepID=A0A7C3SP82_THEPE
MAQGSAALERVKSELRKQVWLRLEASEVVVGPRPCYGRVPGFLGGIAAASKIAKLDLFKRARVLYFTPDGASRPLREEALRRGKTIVMSQPNLKGYVVLEGSGLPESEVKRLSTLRGALLRGERALLLEGIKVDVIVLGSVAVDRSGARLGRGDGLYDLEYALLREMHAAGADTPVLTLVHGLQVLEEGIPMLPHDVPVDIIATPAELIVVSKPRYRKPSGVIWDLLPIQRIKASRVLSHLFGLA